MIRLGCALGFFTLCLSLLPGKGYVDSRAGQSSSQAVLVFKFQVGYVSLALCLDLVHFLSTSCTIYKLPPADMGICCQNSRMRTSPHFRTGFLGGVGGGGGGVEKDLTE